MSKKEPTTSDILGAINDFANQVEERFDGVDKRFDGVDKRFDKVEERLDILENNMVTKDYLDDKILDLRADLTISMRKEDKKVETLVEILHKKKIINKAEKADILKMEPFPKGV